MITAKFGREIISILAIMLCGVAGIVFASLTLWSAAQHNTPARHEVVVLFDINAADKWHESGILAPSTLREMMDALPDDWNIGLVTFDSGMFDKDIINVISPGADTRERVHTALVRPSRVSFERSPVFFSGTALSKTIVFLSNNEAVILPIEDASPALADAVIEEIVHGGFVVYRATVGLEAPDGYDYEEDQEPERPAFGSSLFSFMSPTQNRNAAQNFTIALSGGQDELEKVIITSQNPIEYIVISADDNVLEMEIGQRFAVIEVDNLTSAPAQIDFSVQGAASISTALVQDTEQSRLWLSGPAHDSVFLASIFDGALVPFFAQGIAPQLNLGAMAEHVAEPINIPPVGTPQSPVIVAFETPATTQAPADTQEPDADIENDNNNDNEDDSDDIDDEPVAANEIPATTAPPPAEPTAEPTSAQQAPVPITGLALDANGEFAFTPSVIMLIATFGVPIIVVGGFLINEKRKARAKRRTKAAARASEALELPVTPLANDMFKFAGKFDVYINQSDEFTAGYALFKMKVGEEASVRDILAKCSHFKGLEDLPDPEYVYFTLNSMGTLKITNDSDCDVYIKTEKLKLNRRRTISQGDNIHITFGEKRELIISPRFLFQAD